MILKNIANSIYLIPIRSLLIHETVGDRWTIIEHLESESSFRITPVTRQNKNGSLVNLYSNVEITCYVPHNDYFNNDLIDRLDEINLVSNQIHLKLGQVDDFLYSASKVINSSSKQKIVLNDCKLSYEIEYVQNRPRMIIKIRRSLKQTQIKNIFY